MNKEKKHPFLCADRARKRAGNDLKRDLEEVLKKHDLGFMHVCAGVIDPDDPRHAKGIEAMFGARGSIHSMIHVYNLLEKAVDGIRDALVQEAEGAALAATVESSKAAKKK